MDINSTNIYNIRYQIQEKKKSNPYYGTYHDGSNVLTDYDNFPYNRYFRGIPESEYPIVAEREAGWRPRFDKCYNVQEKSHKENKLKNCFETACSTVYPCYPNILTRFADRDQFNVMLNNSCIVEYR